MLNSYSFNKLNKQTIDPQQGEDRTKLSANSIVNQFEVALVYRLKLLQSTSTPSRIKEEL